MSNTANSLPLLESVCDLHEAVAQVFKRGNAAVVLETQYASDMDDLLEAYTRATDHNTFAELTYISYNRMNGSDRLQDFKEKLGGLMEAYAAEYPGVHLGKIKNLAFEMHDRGNYTPYVLDLVKYQKAKEQSGKGRLDYRCLVDHPYIEAMRESENLHTSYYAAAALEALPSINYDFLIIRNIQQFFPKEGEVTGGDPLLANAIRSLCMRGLEQLNGRAAQPVKPQLLMTIDSAEKIPTELAPYVYVKKVDPPTEDDIKGVLETWRRNDLNGFYIDEKFLREMMYALKGLRQFEIREVLAELKTTDFTEVDKDGKVQYHKKISEKKKQWLYKSGLLDWVNPIGEEPGGMNDVVGWLKKDIANIFQHLGEAKNLGLALPKGMLISGIPGTGKSLLAKYCAKVLEIPLLQMDIGRLMGQYVGDSERNLRRALRLAELFSPCVLFIDELEKGFAGADGKSGDTVFLRMFATLLGWLQEKEEKGIACFVFATANDVTVLKPEFLRPGRFDEKYFLFMPTQKECKAIFRYHLRKGKREKYFDKTYLDSKEADAILNEVLAEAAKTTPGKFMIGADIEAIVGKAFLKLMQKYLRLRPQEEKLSSNEYEQEKKNWDDGRAAFYREHLEECLMDALAESKTYSENYLDQIALTWLKMREKKFKSAAKDNEELLPFDEFILDKGEFTPALKTKWNGGEDYDSKMATAIMAEIERQRNIGMKQDGSNK